MPNPMKCHFWQLESAEVCFDAVFNGLTFPKASGGLKKMTPPDDQLAEKALKDYLNIRNQLEVEKFNDLVGEKVNELYSAQSEELRELFGESFEGKINAFRAVFCR